MRTFHSVRKRSNSLIRTCDMKLSVRTYLISKKLSLWRWHQNSKQMGGRSTSWQVKHLITLHSSTIKGANIINALSWVLKICTTYVLRDGNLYFQPFKNEFFQQRNAVQNFRLHTIRRKTWLTFTRFLPVASLLVMSLLTSREKRNAPNHFVM